VTGPGVYYDLSRAEYDAIPAVNFSSLKHIARSPAHYRAALSTPRADTDAMRVGRCTHLAVLEPERYAEEVAVWDGGRRVGSSWRDFCSVHEGCEVLTDEQAATCQAIATAVRQDPDASVLVTGGRSEVSVVWEVEVVPGLKVLAKARIDYVGPGGLMDLKTTRDASPRAFSADAYKRGYPSQCAFYADGWFAATGQRLPFYVVAVESDAPHVVQTYDASGLIPAGRAEYMRWLLTLEECRVTDEWPGYARGVVALELPGWVSAETMDFPEEVACE
jgi:hypothetical protein